MKTVGKPKLFFVIPEAPPLWGSTVMRGVQLCRLVDRHLSDSYEAQLAPMPFRRRRYPLRSWVYLQRMWAATRPRDALYLVTKQCVERFDPVAAEILQSRARAVLFDYVDADMSTVSMRGADVHLSASAAQYAWLRRKQSDEGLETAVAHLPHGFDPRLTFLAPKLEGPLRPIYLGAETNAHLPGRVRERVPVIEVSTSEAMAAALGRIGTYNLHYCLRPAAPQSHTAFKPFTKGLTAAACGANVLVARDAHDAEALLGADYPYFVDALDEATILEALARAGDEIGGPEWCRAAEIMADLARKGAPGHIVSCLDDILRPLAE